MKFLVMIPLIFTSFTLQAAVYKCSDASGKTIYQASPCPLKETGRELAIKTDPQVEIAAKSKLAALQTQMAAEKAEQQQAAAEETRQKYRTEQLDVLKRNAFAQQQRAFAEQREADALEKRNQLNTNPITLAPAFVSSMPPPEGITPAHAFSTPTPPPVQGINLEASRQNPVNRESEIPSAIHGQPEHADQQHIMLHSQPLQGVSPPANHQNSEPKTKDEQKQLN